MRYDTAKSGEVILINPEFIILDLALVVRIIFKSHCALQLPTGKSV
jgi:hypothetical protein